MTYGWVNVQPFIEICMFHVAKILYFNVTQIMTCKWNQTHKRNDSKCYGQVFQYELLVTHSASLLLHYSGRNLDISVLFG